MFKGCLGRAMSSSSKKAARHQLSNGVLFGPSTFRWADFVHPSTLQLRSFVQLLLEPVTCVETFERVELGLQEALINAVQHGNDCDPNKKLRVRRIVTPNWMIWQIQDQGDGVPLPAREGRLPDQLDSNTGRGLFLIHQCFDDVRWSPRGNRLQLACRRTTKNDALDSQGPLALF